MLLKPLEKLPRKTFIENKKPVLKTGRNILGKDKDLVTKNISAFGKTIQHNCVKLYDL